MFGFKTKKERSLLAAPKETKEKTLVINETIKAVEQFYKEGEHSRHMPGMKIFVSLKKMYMNRSGYYCAI